MSLTALLFVSLVILGALLSFKNGPVWGLVTYIGVYFITPNPNINWWAAGISNMRWSIVITLVIVASILAQGTKSIIWPVPQVDTVKYLILYLLLSLTVSFFAVDITMSLERCYELFRYIVVFLLMIVIIKDEKDIGIILLTLVVCGLALGYMAYSTPRISGRLENIGPPDANNSNALGLVFAGLIPLCLALFQNRHIFYKCLSVAAFVFMANGLILCNSRGAALSLISAIFTAAFFLNIRRYRPMLIVLLVIVTCGMVYLADDQFAARFSSIENSAETDQGSGRLEIWKSSVQMIKDHPFGAGGRGFQLLSPTYLPESSLTRLGIRSSHNTYILVLAEQGIIGLGIFLLFHLTVFGFLRKTYHILKLKLLGDQVNDENTRILFFTTVSLLSSYFAYLIGSMFGDRLYFEFIYVIAGLASALYFVVLRNDSNKENVVANTVTG